MRKSKKNLVKVRLTDQEKIVLKEKAEAFDMTMSDYVRYCCLISPPKKKEIK